MDLAPFVAVAPLARATLARVARRASCLISDPLGGVEDPVAAVLACIPV